MSDLEGEILDTYIEMGARWERQAIVAWLRGRDLLDQADAIADGEHLGASDE